MSGVSARSRNRQAGFTLIDMLFVVALVGLLMTLAIPGLLRARGAAQASSALGTMRTVGSAQLSYAISCGLGFYSPDFQTLGVKPPAAGEAFLSPELSSAAFFVRSGYTFSMAGNAVAGAPGTCNGLGPGSTSAGYALVADPLQHEATARYFGTNADAVIYENSASLAATMPESGAPPGAAPIR